MADIEVNEQAGDKTDSKRSDQDILEEAKKRYQDILEEAKKRYRLCLDAMTENLNDARADLQFLKGGTNQWDPIAVTAREGAGLPMITVNTLPAFLHQVTNDQRMNTPMIKVHPVDDNSDIKTARVIQGLIRHIEYDSNADVAEDTAVNCAAAVGFGYFRLITDFESPDSFDQCVKYGRLPNPLAVKIDPLSSEADGSDMEYCFIESLMGKADFEREYPDADATSATAFSTVSDNSVTSWITNDTVMVVEYYAKEYTPDTLVELSNGEVGFKSQLLEIPEGITIIRERESSRCKVMWRKITAVDVLEETEIKCEWIPVFPVYGDEINIDGKVTRSGIIRNAKGPASMYNVFMTAATEETMLRAKSPYMMAEGQEQGHEQEFQMANRAPLAFITYKPKSLDGTLLPPPQRTPTADVPVGMLAMGMQAKENIMATTGLFQASLGQKGTATSGKQELAQQREGDVANFHYMDGLLRSLRHCGRCLVSMIPNYYNRRRTVRILGDDDTAEHAVINDVQVENKVVNGQMVAVEKVLNDVTVGKYDVRVAPGQSFTTMRLEAQEFYTGAMQAAKDPVTAAVVTYLAMKNQDSPYAELAANLIKSTLPPVQQQIIDDETGGDKGNDGEEQEPVAMTPEGPLPLSQVPQAIEALKAQIVQSQEAMKQADFARQQAELMKQQNEAQKLKLEAEKVKIEAFRAETERAEMEQSVNSEQMKAVTETEKERTEQLRIQAEAVREQMERDATAEERGAIPSVDDVVKLIMASKADMPTSMTIKAPSGQVYQIDMGGVANGAQQ